MARDESERIISLLKNAIRLSNFTYRDVERQLGWRVGTITRLMRGGLGLKIEHLLSILRVIGFSPGRFFAAAFPAPGPATASPGMVEDRLYRTLEQMYGDPDRLRRAVTLGSSASQDEIDEMVRVSLRKLIGGRVPAAADQDGEPRG